MSTVEQEIQHLDFDVKDERKHYCHPIDPNLWWCGEQAPPMNGTPGDGVDTEPSEITCPGCLHLYIERGGAWWHRVNRAWYGK